MKKTTTKKSPASWTTSIDYRIAWKAGARAAARAAQDYDSLSSHRFRVSDCILVKLNVVNSTRPRNNPHAKNEFLKGFALALASMNRAVRLDLDVAAVMREAGVTTAMLEKAGVEEYDLACLPPVVLGRSKIAVMSARRKREKKR